MADNINSDSTIEEDSDILDMSDEDFENMDWDAEEDSSDTDQDSEEDSSSEENDVTEDSDEEQDDETDTDDEADAEESGEGEESSDEEEADSDSDDEEQNEGEDSSDDSAQAQLDKLFAPFTANGEQMQVKSVDEALKLMQMGVGFHGKMAALKPNLKLMRMLDKNGLLDEGKLSFLIDLHKNEPNAISKLLKENNVDPLEVDVEEADSYTPNDYSVDDNELALADAIENIRGTEASTRTLDIVSKQWDETSQGIIAKNPQLIQVINDQVANGIFDQITSEVVKRRMLGQLSTGVSDIEAYKVVGDLMHAEGKFGTTDKPNKSDATDENTNTPTDVTEKSKKLKSRKKAASPTKTRKVAENKPKPKNYLDMSDDEFLKEMGG